MRLQGACSSLLAVAGEGVGSCEGDAKEGVSNKQRYMEVEIEEN